MPLDRTIHFCIRCETKNRIPKGQEALAVCGKCGKPIYPKIDGNISNVRTGKTRNKNRAHSSYAGANFAGSLRLLFWLGLAGFFGYLWLWDGTDGKKISQRIDFEDLVPIADAVPIAPGIQWNKSGRSSVAPFEIVTRGEENFFVKLVDAATGADMVGVFAPAGRRTEVTVPLGVYKLRYASGKTWRGESQYFGPGDLTSFSQSDSVFSFDSSGGRTTGYTVELFRQVDGNMKTSKIDRSRF